jgi:hypothetical protein
MSARHLVLVTGAGRSGTSTAAGALHMLGFHLPRPVLHANESNPRGFFESRWPVRFHRRLMDRALMEQTDGRPVAADLIARQVDDGVRAELREWLAKQFERSADVMVKDPRAAWVPGLWVEQAAALEARTSFVTMLRAPAEVVRSRESHYHGNRPYMDDRAFAVMNLAGWVNANLVLERQTRDQARAYVRYDDLRADWRSAMRVLRDDLDLRLNHPLSQEPHAEVDAFVEPGLNRHQGSWEGLDLPAALIAIADGVHTQLGRLADAHGHDPGPEAALDDLAADYAALYRESQEIAVDATTAHGRAQRRLGQEEGRQEGAQAQRDRALHRRAARAVRRRFPMR